jgi:nucleotide-binding universal stress UspA family protein
MFEKILLAIDGSDHSAKAVPVVGDLATKLGSQVSVLHVREREASKVGAFDLETAEEGSTVVEDAVNALKGRGVDALGEMVHTVYGNVAQQILATAEDEGASLIVMGSRGLSEWTGLLLGSVTQKVLHLGRIPVLVIR